ncbi:Ltp family lipoprotein [Brevundimonas sp.]|uniref:Ltp family lipoprotein n=1 Tax=Brevundimonas sp. TaxID=1871086 RepID=UPI00286D432B|nr:Ltp family lipoprotein [Brevundimonas sp.]
MKLKLSIFAAMAGGAMLVSSCGVDTTSTDTAAAESADQEEAAEAVSALTGPQRNAARSARDYLTVAGFSRDGLIQQLSSSAGDGYSEADATAAVDSLDADWNANAARSARDYLEISGFSCSGMVQQLSSRSGDKYTREQAEHGAREAGAC